MTTTAKARSLFTVSFVTLVSALSLAACATADLPGPGTPVLAALETPSVGSENQDAADDPAIWASARPVSLAGQSVRGFVAGTDKKAGLYIYGLDGQILQFLGDGLLNNVDVIDGVTVGGRPQVLLGASDRGVGGMGVRFYLYDPAETAPDNNVRPWGVTPIAVSEPYGFCFGRRGAETHAILVSKDGVVVQTVVGEAADGTPTAREVRRFAVGSISEGCAVDEASDALFIGQEPVGVWRYGFDPASGDARTAVGTVDGTTLTADVEGATILNDGDKRYLLVSSQGDSTFAVWRIDQGAPAYAGRFSVHDGPGGDHVTGTDGLDALGGPVGDAFPEGLVVVQDDINDVGTQNFKYIDWRVIRTALGL